MAHHLPAEVEHLREEVERLPAEHHLTAEVAHLPEEVEHLREEEALLGGAAHHPEEDVPLEVVMVASLQPPP